MGSNKWNQSCVVRFDHPEGDYYATNPQAALDLMRLEPQIRHIWEPACGQGHLAKMFLKYGKLARATDIIDRGYVRQEGTLDFLRYDGEKFRGDIVTNPPYDIALDFTLKALDVVEDGQWVAMFLPITYLDSKSRYARLFKKMPPLRLWIYVTRMSCAKNSDFENYPHSNLKSYAWFIWHKGEYPGTTINWIDPEISQYPILLWE